MKQTIYILLAGLALSGLIFTRPVSSNQSRTFIQTVSHPKCATVQQSNKQESVDVDKAVRLLVDTMFRKNNVEEAFEQYFQLSALSAEETNALKDMGYDPFEVSKYKDAKTAARVLTVRWNYEYQPALLALSTTPLSSGANFKKSFEQAQVDIDAERERVLNRHGMSADEFYRLLDLEAVKDPNTLERNLTALENINAEIARFIEQKANKAIFSKNLAEMQRTFRINNRDAGVHALYEVSLKPMFKVVFSRQGEILKVIGFGDVL